MAAADRLFGRTDGARDGGEGARLRRRREVVARLCGSADFREWLRDALDDLCAYERDEGRLTDFGQGIRAAANRLRNRLLVAREAVGMLADFAREDYAAYHEALAGEERQENDDER